MLRGYSRRTVQSEHEVCISVHKQTDCHRRRVLGQRAAHDFADIHFAVSNRRLILLGRILGLGFSRRCYIRCRIGCRRYIRRRVGCRSNVISYRVGCRRYVSRRIGCRRYVSCRIGCRRCVISYRAGCRRFIRIGVFFIII